MVTLTNHVSDQTELDLHCSGPWHFGDFCKIFLPNIGEDQKKVLLFEHGGPGTVQKVLLFEHGCPGTVPYGKFALGYCVSSIKKLDEGLIKQPLGQNLISPWLHI